MSDYMTIFCRSSCWWCIVVATGICFVGVSWCYSELLFSLACSCVVGVACCPFCFLLVLLVFCCRLCILYSLCVSVCVCHFVVGAVMFWQEGRGVFEFFFECWCFIALGESCSWYGEASSLVSRCFDLLFGTEICSWALKSCILLFSIDIVFVSISSYPFWALPSFSGGSQVPFWGLKIFSLASRLCLAGLKWSIGLKMQCSISGEKWGGEQEGGEGGGGRKGRMGGKGRRGKKDGRRRGGKEALFGVFFCFWCGSSVFWSVCLCVCVFLHLFLAQTSCWADLGRILVGPLWSQQCVVPSVVTVLRHEGLVVLCRCHMK